VLSLLEAVPTTSRRESLHFKEVAVAAVNFRKAKNVSELVGLLR
jgi:hypothetical protein